MRVLLFEPSTGERWLAPIQDTPCKIPGLGMLDTRPLADAEFGDHLRFAGKDVIVLPFTPADYHATLRRKAQIIGMKDASRIVGALGLAPGMRVLESGIGSGGTTLHMLRAVAPDGEVVVQELREDFAEWASDNVASAGLDDGLKVFIGDLTKGVAEGVAGPFDACLLDMPEPWLALPKIFPMLAPGARICCYCPQVSQMERSFHLLKQMECADVEAMELIERQWEVKDLGARPSFEALGHTGFLVFARWIG